MTAHPFQCRYPKWVDLPCMFPGSPCRLLDGTGSNSTSGKQSRNDAPVRGAQDVDELGPGIEPYDDEA